ncbi:hypothetical protein PRIC2_012402 [Phytophthora ramorum]
MELAPWSPLTAGGLQPLDNQSMSEDEEELLLLLHTLSSQTVDSDEDGSLKDSLMSLQQWSRPNAATSSSSEDTAKETQVARRPAMPGTIKRRKVEMGKLRREEHKLRARLAQLKAVAEEQERMADADLSCAEQEAAMVQRSKAEHEAKRRQLSVRKNNGLRAALERQVGITKSLRRFLQRRMRQQTMKSAVALRTHQELLSSMAGNVCLRDPVFDKLIVGLDEVYASVDRVFENVGIHELPCPGRKSVAIRGTSKKCIEFLDCFAVPFDTSSTAGAVWNCLAELDWKGPKHLASSYFDKARNVLLSCWVSSFTSGDLTVSITNCKVTRKYVEQTRTVFISQTFIEPKTLPPVVFYETVRRVVRQNGFSDLGPTSVMESHREATQYDKNDISRIVPTVDRVGAAAWDAAVTHFNHRVEDALVRNKWRNVLNA